MLTPRTATGAQVVVVAMAETLNASELDVMSETQLRAAKEEVAAAEAHEAVANIEAAEDFAAAMGEGEEDDEFQIVEDGDDDEYGDEDYEGADDGDDFEATAEDENSKPYQNKLQAEVVRKKNTSITMSQAKLFGIPMDKTGKVSVPGARPPDTDKQLTKILSRIGKMSDPVQSDLSHIKSEDDLESTFKPQKSAAALALMRNPKLGYDFIEKLDSEKDGFLKRAFDNKDGEMTSLEKIKKADAEEEYKLSKDKLECPVHMANHKCRREQSFTEFWEKKRYCPQCKVRFVKMNVCDPHKFEKRMKENEIKRQERLKKVEDSMYNYEKPKYRRPKDFAVDLPSSHVDADGGKKGKAGAKQEFVSDAAFIGKAGNSDVSGQPREPVVKSVGKVYVPVRGEKDGDGGEEGKTEEELSAELLEKLATLNSSKAALMEEVVAAAESKVKQAKEFDRSTTEAKVVSGNLSRASSRATAKSGGGKSKTTSASKSASVANSIAASKGGSRTSATSKGSKKSHTSVKDKGPATSAPPAESKGDKFDKLLL